MANGETATIDMGIFMLYEINVFVCVFLRYFLYRKYPKNRAL